MYIQINEKAPIEQQIKQLKTQLEIIFDNLEMESTATGDSLPEGGTDGQVLTKQTDGSADWEDPSSASNGLPTGGTTDQILAKNSNADFDGKWVAQYTHPASHNPSIIAEDENNRFVTDEEIAAWNAKQAALGFTPEDSANKKTSLADNSDTFYPSQKAVKTAVDGKADAEHDHSVATELTDGLMSSEDKISLDTWTNHGGDADLIPMSQSIIPGEIGWVSVPSLKSMLDVPNALEKAIGSEVNTGTNDTKYVTPKAIKDSNLIESSDGTVINVIKLTKAQYDALSTAEQENGTIYITTDEEDANFGLATPTLDGWMSAEDKAKVNELFPPVLLWTNPSPTASFAAQTITVPDMSEYDMIEIMFEYATSDGHVGTSRVKGGKGGWLEATISGARRFRTFTIPSATQITFTDAKYNGMGSSAATTENVGAIPLYVIGIKNGLFI